jgi:hypothetical protein
MPAGRENKYKEMWVFPRKPSQTPSNKNQDLSALSTYRIVFIPAHVIAQVIAHFI